MKTRLTLIAATLALALPLGTALAQPAASKDGILVGPTLMTLYTFDKDSEGKSVCNGQCATNWPPLTARPDDKPAGDWTIFNRDDGTRQWAYKGKPVYYWLKDSKPGDTTGDGIGNVWRIARP